jgi:hypothetical protein
MDIWDFFEREMGSKIWPSDDPKDSPFDKFVCKHCGETVSIQMFGTCPITNSFEDQAYKILCKHLLNCLIGDLVPDIKKEVKNG